MQKSENVENEMYFDHETTLQNNHLTSARNEEDTSQNLYQEFGQESSKHYK